MHAPTATASGSEGSVDQVAKESGWTWAALVVGLATVSGSLLLSLGMELKACPLCFYQRSFALAVVAVLLVGVFIGSPRPGYVPLLALPLAMAGLAVALFHTSLEWRGRLECPSGVLGLGTAPQQSLAAFVLLTALLLLGAAPASQALAAISVAAIVGAALAVASLVANPPMPSAPTKPYDKQPDICRPPYVG